MRGLALYQRHGALGLEALKRGSRIMNGPTDDNRPMQSATTILPDVVSPSHTLPIAEHICSTYGIYSVGIAPEICQRLDLCH